jgi:hypothetical protein
MEAALGYEFTPFFATETLTAPDSAGVAACQALIDTSGHGTWLTGINLYVSNLPYPLTDEEFQGVFAAHG